MRRQFENIPQDDAKGDELPPPDEEEERLSPAELALATPYSFENKTYRLTDNGHLYNEDGQAVTSSRRRQVLEEGQAVKKAA